MSSQTAVDRLHLEIVDLLRVLETANEFSLRSTADDNFRKSLLLSASSHFEHRITEEVIAFIRDVSDSNPLITSFVRNKAISRQFHTWFKWEANNANHFFGLFGRDYRSFMVNQVQEDNDLNDSIKAFLELGRERNRLVHQDFGSFPLEKTSEEIYELYLKASIFINRIPESLKSCSTMPQTESE